MAQRSIASELAPERIEVTPQMVDSMMAHAKEELGVLPIVHGLDDEFDPIALNNLENVDSVIITDVGSAFVSVEIQRGEDEAGWAMPTVGFAMARVEGAGSKKHGKLPKVAAALGIVVASVLSGFGKKEAYAETCYWVTDQFGSKYIKCDPDPTTPTTKPKPKPTTTTEAPTTTTEAPTTTVAPTTIETTVPETTASATTSAETTSPDTTALETSTSVDNVGGGGESNDSSGGTSKELLGYGALLVGAVVVDREAGRRRYGGIFGQHSWAYGRAKEMFRPKHPRPQRIHIFGKPGKPPVSGGANARHMIDYKPQAHTGIPAKKYK